MIELLSSRIAPATFIVTSLADAGPGSLREAIAEANDLPGADVIRFAGRLEGVIQLTTGQMPITDTLAIKGPGASKVTLDAGLRSRIFSVSDLDPATDSPLSVSGLTFLRGEQPATAGPDESGGAILSEESLTMKGCVFFGNKAEGRGGAISVFRVVNSGPVSMDIRNCTFVNNTSGNFAGALHVEVNGPVTVKNCLFRGNTSDDLGGAAVLTVPGETLLVQNCQFRDNHSTIGGALLAVTDAEGTVIVRGSLFLGNTASASDGAGSVSGGKILVEKSVFLQNVSVVGAGGLSAGTFSSLVIRSSQFIDNIASGPGPVSGGGGLQLFIEDGDEARIISSIISGNSAAQGGGIFVDEGAGSLEIVGSRITNNHATSDGGGILILAAAAPDTGTELSILRSKLSGNTSEIGNGGAVAMFGEGEFTMISSRVTENISNVLGGGIALFNTGPSTVIGSLIAQNAAASGGGIGTNARLEVSNSRILSNTSVAGGGISSAVDLELNFCIVSGNFAELGGGIFHANGTDVELNRTKVLRNTSADGQQITESGPIVP